MDGLTALAVVVSLNAIINGYAVYKVNYIAGKICGINRTLDSHEKRICNIENKLMKE